MNDDPMKLILNGYSERSGIITDTVQTDVQFTANVLKIITIIKSNDVRKGVVFEKLTIHLIEIIVAAKYNIERRNLLLL